MKFIQSPHKILIQAQISRQQNKLGIKILTHICTEL